MIDFVNCMSVDFKFICPLPNGFHARPASHLAAVAGGFTSDCSLTNLRNQNKADLKSVLSLIAADIRINDECFVHIEGEDAESAATALRRFVEQELPECDVPLPDVYKESQARQLPRALRSLGVQAHFGIPASSGIGQGKAVMVRADDVAQRVARARTRSPIDEKEQIRRAIAAVSTRIQNRLAQQISAVESGILQAHLAMLSDAALTGKLLELAAGGASAAEAVAQGSAFFSDLLRRSENPYMRERAIDIQGLCLELIENISPSKSQSALELSELSIVIAENLTPQQLLACDRKWLAGLVLESTGTTSHTLILARSLGLPALVGVKDAHYVSSGQEILVDANRGFLVPELIPEIRRFYEREATTLAKRKAALAGYANAAAQTADGNALGVAANVSSAEEAAAVFESGADAIGVFRTEMLFLGREHLPTEQEQFEVYAQAARAARGKPVVLRTLDVGGDKILAGVKPGGEANPFLGYRGIRIYPEHQEILNAQLRAILRASAHGRVQILVPMVSTLEEVLWFKQQVRQVQQELEAHHVAFDRSIPLGIMVEVPSVAFILEQLCREVDFFSIGTNDLSQYFFAADRGNFKVSGLANVRHPAFLRFLQQITSGARKNGKAVTVCGDMAADRRNLPLLIALGLDDISVPGGDIPGIKERIAQFSLSHSQKLLSQAMVCRDVAEVEKLLDREAPVPSRTLLDCELILLRDEVGSKEEAIRELADAFYIDGRTDDPDRLEETVWNRESVYSTGLGHGFAVPHCKTDAISTSSMAVLKLKKPVDWGSLDGDPVQFVILLAARESDAGTAHLRVFAQLARNLMDEGFREKLLKADDRDAILSALTHEFAKSA